MSRSLQFRKPLHCPLVLFLGLMFAANAQADVEKINLGLYGGQVADIEAFDNGGATEILIAVDSSQRGVFKWDASTPKWSSVTFPTTTATGSIVGPASQVEFNPNSSSDVYATVSTATVHDGLYVSPDGGDVVAGAVSWVEANKTTGGQLDEVTVLRGDASGIYAGTSSGEVYLNTGGASSTFTSVFSGASAGRVLSIAVTSSSSGYVLMEDLGVLTLWQTDWAGGNTDLSGNLPATAPVENWTGSCPVSDCSLDVRLVAADPEDSSGQILYIAGSSVNAMAFRSDDGGDSWNNGWDYQCGLSASGCESNGFMDGFPSVIRFKGSASGGGGESRFVFISTSILDNDATTPSWSGVPNLSSTIQPSGPSGPTVIQFTTHANDPSLDIDPNDSDVLYIATDMAIGEIAHDSTTGFPEPSGEEMANARGIEGVVIYDMDFFENSPTDKDLWIATKSGVGKALNFDPTDPASTAAAGDWVYPIFPRSDGAPPTAVAINPSDSSQVFVGNGKVYRNDLSTSLPEAATDWTLTFSPSDFDGIGEPLESDRSDRTRTTALEFQQYGSCDRVYMTAANEDTGSEGGVFYTDDAGVSWSADDLNSGSSLLKMPVNALWVSDQTVWVGVGDDSGQARSPETGIRARLSLCLSSSFWQPSCSSDATITQMQSEVVAAIDGVEISGDHTVYVVTQDSVYRGELPSGSPGGFCSWTFSDIAPVGGSQFTSVAVDDGDADHVWVSYGNCIQESSDGGASWADYGSSCQPEHEMIQKLVFDDLLAGTDNGLFVIPEPTALMSSLAALLTLHGLARARRRKRGRSRP